jgi:hypothetical protein
MNHHLLGLLGQSRLRFTPSDLVAAWRIYTKIPALVPEPPQQLRRDSSFCQEPTLVCTQMSRAKSPYASTYGYSYAGLAFLPHSFPHSRLSGYDHGLLSLGVISVLCGAFAPKDTSASSRTTSTVVKRQSVLSGTNTSTNADE